MTLAELKEIIKSKYLHKAKITECVCGGYQEDKIHIEKPPIMAREDGSREAIWYVCKACRHSKEKHNLGTGHCMVEIGGYELSSGKISDKYFDIKSLVLHTGDDSSIFLLGELFHKLKDIEFKFKSIGGLELGGALLAAQMAWDYEGPEPICVIRKGERTHGMKKMIEGNPVSPILLVDDVLSTGHSVKDAIRTCHKEGYEVAGLLCVIDRTYIEDMYGRRFYDSPPGLWFHDIKPIGKEKNHLDGLDLPVYALFKEREDDPLGEYNKDSVFLFKE